MNKHTNQKGGRLGIQRAMSNEAEEGGDTKEAATEAPTGTSNGGTDPEALSLFLHEVSLA